jgi:uncharacterized repeat protein (TIGR01451 family)
MAGDRVKAQLPPGRHVLPLVATVAMAMAAHTGPAAAAVPGVGWSVHVVAQPTNFQATDTNDQYSITVANDGSADSSGPVTVTDVLPAGVTTAEEPKSSIGGEWQCTPGAGNSVVTCTSAATVHALGRAPAIFIPVQVAAGASGPNAVTVSGGVEECAEAGHPPCPSASAGGPALIGTTGLPFGVLDFSISALDPGGAVDTRAGDHPAAFTSTFDTPSANAVEPEGGTAAMPVEDLRQVVVDLPAGVEGNALATPTCALTELTNRGRCPGASLVGSLELITPPNAAGVRFLKIFNVTPEQGYPAEFGFYLPDVQRAVMLYATVRTGSDYGLRLISTPPDRFLQFSGVSTTFFGTPSTINKSGAAPVPFFTNPSDCSASGFTTTIHVDSWQHPGRFNSDGAPDFSDPSWKQASSTAPPVTGCESLHFNPALSALPSSHQAGAPTGLAVDLNVPQDEQPGGLGTPPVKDTTITFPQGMVVSPSAADGLGGCTDAQIDLGTAAPGACPAASQIGTVKVDTPVLASPLEGHLYVGTPQCNSCTNADAQSGRMLRVFLQAQGSGVVVKLAGNVSVDPATGRLTATFKHTPQQPFDDLKVTLKEGDRAPLANPRACGTYTTTSDLTPWSSPFTPDATPTSSFEVVGCTDPGRFTPSFIAGTVNPQAGAFSPFTLSFSRQDSDQPFSGLTAGLPPGLLAKLAGVPLCSDADAAAGRCPAASQVGTVTTGAGPGSHPFFLPGTVYLTGPYRGAPYGLSVEVPAVAGPFNLGTVVVRQSLQIDAHDAHVTATSDPFPTILDGIPLQLRAVNVTIDRPAFVMNPTSCDPTQIAATLSSTDGATSHASSRFQAAGCASLDFAPTFKALTQAHTSKRAGASLRVDVTSGPGQANIGKVKVDLPRQLPSRLSTLQKACPEGVFNANPASCPEGSVVGAATAVTPLLAHQLTGPAILVSHGGAQFPDLVIVLQGDGITLQLDGQTDIKRGITSSSFGVVPDAPISTFDLMLPEGPHSALGAFASLCAHPLLMPTKITGQNGALIKRTTRIAVSGCPARKRHTHGRRRHRRRR